VRTYSWAFETLPQCDERHISDLNARHFGFAATPVPAEESAPLARYPEHGPDRDEPFIGVYQALIERSLALAQRDGVGVLFSGDRGDLLVGGWVQSYVNLLATRRWGALWREMGEHARLHPAGMTGVVLGYLLRPLLARAWNSLRASGEPGFGSSSTPTPPRSERYVWVRRELLERTGVADAALARVADAPAAVGSAPDRTWAVRRALVFSPMLMRGVVWSERTNARFGLGFADPWSDRRLASFVLAIPQQVIDRPGSSQKRLVREAMRGIMPEEVRRASAKILPTPLFQRAMRHEAVDTILGLIADAQVVERGYVDGAALQAAYAEVRAGTRDGSDLWPVLALEMWLRRYWS